MYYQTSYHAPTGRMTLACDSAGKSLVGLWLEGQKYHGSSMSHMLIPKHEIPLFHTVREWLDRYFAGENPGISELPLAPVGSAFRQEVWRLLCEIPYGEVVTYGEIAQAVAAKMGRKSMSSQAVGGAVGHNPISVIIPCHRGVGANGSLTGYSAGIHTKIKLLKLEGVETSAFFVPQKGTAL